MKYTFLICLVLLLFSCKEEVPEITIAFYNVENLFDTEDDPNKNDEWYLPTSEIKWDNEKYQTKLKNLAFVINQIADNEAPDFLGLCEVENRKVLEDLIDQDDLDSVNYGIVHYESPDERGIDNAFLYNKDVFKVQDSENIQVVFDGFDDKTRDILYVKGKLANGDVLHFLVNHWPSRREGKAASEPKRIQVAKIVKQKKDELLANNSNAKIIVLGDFNDEPEDKSVDICLDSEGDIADVDSHELYNTHYELSMQNKGSYKFRQHWNMLDQIMVSKALLSTEPGSLHYKLNSAAIKNEDWLQQHGNKYEGSPLRTYGGRNYLAGYSDHFSVHITLIIDNAK